jgi:hypothetical protein
MSPWVGAVPQLNIFLAILIEGYTVVKAASATSRGMGEELADLVRHESRRLVRHLSRWGGGEGGDGGVGGFVADEDLVVALEKHLSAGPVSVPRALRDYAAIAIRNRLEVATIRI